MKFKYQKITAVFLFLIIILSGCGKQTTDEKITNRFAIKMSKTFDECFKVSDTQGIDNVFNELASCDSFKDKYDSIKLIADSIYTFVEKKDKSYYEISKYSLMGVLNLCSDNSSVRSEIENYYKELIDNMKVLTEDYFIGTWERTDETNFKGAKIRVERITDDNGNKKLQAEITKKPDVNDLKFEKGELKWMNIIIKNDTEIYFDDLIHSMGGMSYDAAKGTLEKSKGILTVHYTDKYSNVSGRNQVWTKIE